jgi:hypothetical protein
MKSIKFLIKYYKKNNQKNIFDIDLPSNIYKSIINYLLNSCDEDDYNQNLISEDKSSSFDKTPGYSFIECESKELALDDYEIC